MGSANSHLILDAQQLWRGQIIDRLGWSDEDQHFRGLASHMLLCLDDPNQCLDVAANWLRERLGADRVDAGLLEGEALRYTPSVEVLRSPAVPTLRGLCFDVRDPLLSKVCSSRSVVAIHDVCAELDVTPPVRDALISVQCRAKLSIALRVGPRPIGLLCADWTSHEVDLSPERQHTLLRAASLVIAPLVQSASLLAAGKSGWPLERDRVMCAHHDRLTPAEWRVAELAGRGLTYKEIARELGRSLSTVDHQLRSIRVKLDAPSTAKLVRMLSQRDERVAG
jgi:DNA-binding CsgD family transcriptional regulator